MKIIADAILLLLLGLVVVNSPVIAAVLPYAITPEEMMRLPPSCAARLKSDMRSPEYQAWRERIGENFVDFHHYCHGIKFVNRYWGARNAYERNYYLQQAKGEFDYIEKGQKPDFTMGAELYSNRGEVFHLMGKIDEALRDWTKALTIDPKLVRPYMQLADLYVKSKNPARALGTITEGLRHLPDSKTLQRRYDELGGKKPYPEPYVARKEESAQQSSEKPAPPAVDNAKDLSTATAEKAENKTPTSELVVVPAESVTQPKIGAPNNPYCRFCPE